MPRGKAPCEGEGRDRPDAGRSQGILRLPLNCGKPWCSLEQVLAHSPGGNQPYRRLDLSLLASQFLAVSLPVAGALLQKPPATDGAVEPRYILNTQVLRT